MAKLPEYRDALGEVRRLGTLAPPPGFRPPFRAPRPALVPEGQWQEFELDCGAAVKVRDQDGYGACNGFACITSLEIARWVAGLEHVDLSPWYVYAQLCGGIDQGSMISDALRLLSEQGTCPDALVDYGVINPRRLSAAATAEAPRFRIEVGSALTSFAELMGQTQLRRPGDFSICVGAGFDDLDADGCPRVSRGAGNHATTFGLGARRGKNGEWLIKCQNSWSGRWGLGGYYWLRESAIARQAYFEAYSVAAVEADPRAADQPPVAPGA